LVWLDPMPLADEIAKAYRDYYTHAGVTQAEPTRPSLFERVRDAYVRRHYGYASTPNQRWPALAIRLHPGWRAEADFSIHHQPAPAPGTRLLDVGCGDGTALLRLRQLGWTGLKGIDPDPLAVTRARAQGLDVERGTLTTHPFPDASFDVIAMSHVIEHVPDPVALLRECRRILKPGGRLVVYTPNIQSWGHRRFQEHWFALEPPRHLYLFRPDNLRQVLERSGPWTVEVLRTTVRGAVVIRTASDDIGRHGSAVMGRGRTPSERVKSLVYLYREAAMLRLRPWVGEEILLMAAK